MFTLDPSLPHIEADYLAVIAIQRSTTAVNLAGSGPVEQPSKAYICAIDESDQVRIYLAIINTKTKIISVYRPDRQPAGMDVSRENLKSAIAFAESMGFEMESVNLNYSKALREVIVRDIHVVKPAAGGKKLMEPQSVAQDKTPVPAVAKPASETTAQKKKELECRKAEEAEAERVAAELAEKEKLAREEAERRRLALEQAEQERIAAEEAALERRNAEEAKAERAAAELAEKERLAREEAERKRLAEEQAEKERIAAEKAALERRKAEEAEAERVAAELAEKEKLAREEAERKRLALEQAKKKHLDPPQQESFDSGTAPSTTDDGDDPFAFLTGGVSAQTDFFSAESSVAPMMFTADPSIHCIRYAAAADVRNLYHSLNMACVSPTGFTPQNCRAFICGVRQEETLLVYFALELSEDEKLLIYVPEQQPGSEELYTATLRGAIDFAEMVGFIMDPHTLPADEKSRLQVIGEAPILCRAE